MVSLSSMSMYDSLSSWRQFAFGSVDRSLERSRFRPLHRSRISSLSRSRSCSPARSHGLDACRIVAYSHDRVMMAQLKSHAARASIGEMRRGTRGRRCARTLSSRGLRARARAGCVLQMHWSMHGHSTILSFEPQWERLFGRAHAQGVNMISRI